ncbi:MULTISPECIES: ABC transporter ATP-binding protein [unclassified Sphingomonas]|uniref:ABC transporter ATP-binding protein n=1 Tax=unclassified Sphingomonas TaxID=196159 RepID=UPI0007009133|nr:MULTISPECIES: ABC transporter ATP-binding protein [unclassified Sphingomonas]KQM66757.1 ABC transporter [Sphingomonas sp. Leaf16]KQN17705.1 ABC transporter [Sphingomonas sp. Leaf29]KQN23568.1 ABC transporter [Sphingomonas sp. Leaf32]
MSAVPHVEVSGLTVTVRRADGSLLRIVDDVSFAVPRGEVLALIGESGSGKTTIALSLMGYARGGAMLGGSIRVGDASLNGTGDASLAAQRGHRITYVAQSAAAAFNPSRRIIDQVIEPALIHRTADRVAARERAVMLFRALALPTPETIGERYPHELSGGQLQRLMAAMALITKPDLVIFDEPTTALDVTTQVEVLQAFRRVFRQERATGIYVSHDLAVVAQMADHILVLNGGRVREQNRAAPLLADPADAYTRMLMGAAHPVIAAGKPARSAAPTPLLSIEGVSAGYGPIGADGRPANPVLSDVSIAIPHGGAVGVIGESGSGKSTVARVVAGLLAPTAGQVTLDGRPLAPGLSARSRDDLRRIQIVFQNADTALNPAHSVGDILGRVIRFYHGATGVEARRRVQRLLDLTQLPAAAIDRRCDELSGGQKQRVNLARALAADPDVILCDEVTSALDTVVRGAILDLLAELRRELGLAYLFISHDIATVRALCDDIVVLYKGTRVETGPADSYARAPWHPYTDLLIGSVPEMRADWLADAPARVTPPFAYRAETSGLCRFLPRCPVAITGRCDTQLPPLQHLSGGSHILCHRNEAELVC